MVLRSASPISAISLSISIGNRDCSRNSEVSSRLSRWVYKFLLRHNEKKRNTNSFNGKLHIIIQAASYANALPIPRKPKPVAPLTTDQRGSVESSALVRLGRLLDKESEDRGHTYGWPESGRDGAKSGNPGYVALLCFISMLGKGKKTRHTYKWSQPRMCSSMIDDQNG